MCSNVQHSENLIIAHWNARGLRNHFQELKLFMAENNLDVMMINETNLTAKDKFRISGYECYRKDRSATGTTNPGGGVLIYIRKTIIHNEVVCDLKNEGLEIVGVRIGKLTIFSLYAPQNTIDEESLDTLFRANKKIVVAGDLNSRHRDWKCLGTNKNGRTLKRYIDKKPYVLIAPDGFTHYPPNGDSPSIIDITLIKNISHVNLELLEDLNSDHYPILIKITSKIKHAKQTNFLNYKTADWSKFRKHIIDNFTVQSNLNTEEKINNATKELTNVIQHAVRVSIKTCKNTTDNTQNADQNIKTLIKERNKNRKIFQRTRNPYYQIKKDLLAEEIKNKLFEYSNKKWKERLEKLTPSNNSLWKLSKFFTKPPVQNIPTLKTSTGFAVKDKDKANALADHFESVHHLTHDFGEKEFDQEILNSYNEIKKLEISSQDICHVTPREVRRAIKQTKSKKAPGFDDIQNIVLKNLPVKAIVQLTNIFNSCFRLSYFPKYWKTAIILPFHKAGKNKNIPQSYRPISLLPTMSKVYEKIILNRILIFEKENKILIPEQFGFRAHRSTVQQLARITNQISNNFNIKKSTAMILLDIEKAFDTVWHEGLIHILHSIGLPIYIIRVLIEYLKNRIFTTKVKNKNSKKRKVAAGVPQGSILGPILFIYFINNIPKSPDTELALFADDTAILASSIRKWLAVKRANNHFQLIYKYFNKWKIKINLEKTELIVFSHKKETVPSIKIENITVEPKKNVKYLGVILDEKLTFTPHINKTVAKGKASQALLYNLLNRKSPMSTKNKTLLYKAIVKPVLLYACPIWSSTCKSNIEKLERIQNKILRMIEKAPQSMNNVKIRSKLGMTTLWETIHRFTYTFYNEKLQDIDILKTIGTYTQETAPFKIKYNLPHNILLQRPSGASNTCK